MLFGKIRSARTAERPSPGKGTAFRIFDEDQLPTSHATAVIHLRDWLKFGQGHFPGSWNVGLKSPDFLLNISVFVEKSWDIILVAEDDRQARQGRLQLLEAGFRNIAGFIKAHRLTRLHRITQLPVSDLKSTLARGGKPQLIDVRSPKEWSSMRIIRSINIPLEALPQRLDELSKWRPLVVVCRDGYRSATAASWLQSKGFESVHHLTGGIDRYSLTPLGEMMPAIPIAAA